MLQIKFVYIGVGATQVKSINLTIRRFVSNKRRNSESDNFDEKNKRLCLENDKGSENFPKVANDNDSINSFGSLKVNINDYSDTPNNEY